MSHTENTEPLPPHSDEAERGILGCLLSGADLTEVARAGLRSGWFYELTHRKVFDAIVAVARDGARPDAATVGSILAQDRELKDGLLIPSQLADATPSSANWPYWLDIVREKFEDRTAAGAVAKIQGILEDPELSREAKIAELGNVALTIQQFLTRQTGSAVIKLADLPAKQRNDPGELLHYRFLCRGGGLLVCGPTGIGKSAWAMQAMVLWAVGRQAFGIEPAKPLRSLLIEAENDPGDLGEMRDGVIAGLALPESEAAQACQQILLVRDDTHTGPRFFTETVAPLLDAHGPDLVWIDPALAYLGGETASQKDVGGFLRNGLNPLLHKFECAAVILHHTNKPPSGKEKPHWSGSDFAYLGSGSIEWPNWARAVLAIRTTGQPGIFELMAGKRGGRLGWKDDNGEKAYSRFIGHSKEEGVICWCELDATEVDSGGRPKGYDPDEVLALLPPEGLPTGDWQKLAKTECGISESTFHRARRSLLKAERILKSQVSGKWQPIKKA